MLTIVRNSKDESLELTIGAGEKKSLVLLSPENLTLHVTQRRDSEFGLHLISLGDASSAVRITVEQNEPGCDTSLSGLALTRGTQVLDVETHVFHNVHHGSSRQLFKNVLADASSALFYGELKVQPDAQKIEAYQTNRNILLSPTAQVRTRPQLEIYADDVKCSHGATTGQLDANALFYLQQRGLPLAEARRLLLQAFLEEVVETIPDTGLREEIQQQINERLG